MEKTGNCVFRFRAEKDPRAKRAKTKVQWTFVPLSGFATDGEPRTCKRSRIAKRSKDFFSIFLVPFGVWLVWAPPVVYASQPCGGCRPLEGACQVQPPGEES